jgi:hypothetical protein
MMDSQSLPGVTSAVAPVGMVSAAGLLFNGVQTTLPGARRRLVESPARGAGDRRAMRRTSLRYLTLVSVPLLFVSLSVLAGPASAGCAWVLWYEEAITAFPERNPEHRTESPPTHARTWTIVQANASEADCQRGLTAEMTRRSRPEPDREISVAANRVVETVFRASRGRRQVVSTTNLRYVCLPDTVDPRRAKGLVTDSPH